MLEVWLSRFEGRCLFDLGTSNLVGSVFSNVSKGWACLLVYLATEHRGADKAEKAGASSISEIGPRGL
ncbi:hypothetical protein ACFX15_023866 [Malus domestica]